MSDIILLGASGHAKVIIDMLHKTETDRKIVLLDDNEEVQGQYILGHKVVGRITDCMKYRDNQFVIAIGNNHIRKMLAEKYDLDYISVIHPSAVIAEDVIIGRGTVVMAGAIVNSGTTIGEHCIINTAATVDHDGRLADYVHLSPGTHLGGTVTIGEESWLGVGSCCKNNICIGEKVVVGVGGAVVQDILETGTYVGVPVKKMK